MPKIKGFLFSICNLVDMYSFYVTSLPFISAQHFMIANLEPQMNMVCCQLEEQESSCREGVEDG